jgi:hypothetical protein
MTSFDAFCLFTSLSMHFKNKKYDYFKYRGKVNLKPESFEKRNDKYAFYKLSKMNDPEGLIVANLFENSKCWVTDCLTKQGDSVYKKRQKVRESLLYTFKSDLSKFDEDFDNNFRIIEDIDIYPKIIRCYLQQKITPETVIIIDRLTNFLSVINGKIQDDIIWPDIYQKLIKYKPFIRVETDIYKNVAIQKFKYTEDTNYTNYMEK